MCEDTKGPTTNR